MESMKDYEKELERSFRTINEGDIVSGAVVAVTDEEVTLDLNYYAPGIIKIENLSNDPDFMRRKNYSRETSSRQRLCVQMTDTETSNCRKRKQMKYLPGINSGR